MEENIQAETGCLGFIKYPIFFTFASWVLFGQLVIFLLKFDHENLRPMIDFISSVIPSVESLREAKVFSNDIARDHHAIMWLFSPILIAISIFYPVQNGEKEFFVKKPSRAIYGGFFLLGLSIISTVLDFYTGVYTLGLALSYYGFAFLSSIGSFFIILAARYIKLSFN